MITVLGGKHTHQAALLFLEQSVLFREVVHFIRVYCALDVLDLFLLCFHTVWMVFFWEALFSLVSFRLFYHRYTSDQKAYTDSLSYYTIGI